MLSWVYVGHQELQVRHQELQVGHQELHRVQDRDSQDKVGKLGQAQRQQEKFNLLQAILSGRKGRDLLLENHRSV